MNIMKKPEEAKTWREIIAKSIKRSYYIRCEWQEQVRSICEEASHKTYGRQYRLLNGYCDYTRGYRYTMYIEGRKVLRYVLYKLGVSQPRRFPGEEQVVTLEELQADIAGLKEFSQQFKAVEDKVRPNESRFDQLIQLRLETENWIRWYGSRPPAEVVDNLLSRIEQGEIVYQLEDEEPKQCPICFVSTEEENFCEHYMGSGYDYYESQEDFSTKYDFHEKVDELCALIQSLEDELDKDVINKAPKDLREIIKWVRENGFYGYYFWTRHEGVESYEYESGGGPGNTFGCRDYFHPEARKFAREIKEEAEHGIAWLQKHRLAHKESKT